MGISRPPMVEKARALFDIANKGTIHSGNIADDADLQRMAKEENAPTEQERTVLDQFAK